MPRTKKPRPPFLSQYLQELAQPFLVYPAKQPKAAGEGTQLVDRLSRDFVEWKKTFAPTAPDRLAAFLSQPTMLDQFYTRELLSTIPGIVGRTLSLKDLSLAGIPDKAAVAQLREAATAYIYGLFRAAIALTRSAMEFALRARASALVGRSAVEDADLKELIDRYGPKILSKTSLDFHGPGLS